MPTTASVLADSIAPSGARITTMLISYPRIVHAEMTRHRAFSRSVGSSRAIPVARQRDAIVANPFVPNAWGENQRGMVAAGDLDEDSSRAAEAIWRAALADMERHTKALEALRVHKQLANRLLEVFSYTTEVVTATDWENLFVQRRHPDAQPQIREVSELMYDAYTASTPKLTKAGEWHLPFADDATSKNLPLDVRQRISAARCARTSYLTHDGRHSVDDDLALFDRLLVGGAIGHMSPMEHQATPLPFPGTNRSRNFHGWHQWRESIESSYSNLVRTLSPSKA